MEPAHLIHCGLPPAASGVSFGEDLAGQLFPDNYGADTLWPVCHMWHDDNHRAHPNAGQQLCHHIQEQAVEKQDKHQEKAAAGEGHQEGQHPPQPRLLQWDVWGITVFLKFSSMLFQVHHKDEVILTPSDDGSREFYDSYAVRQVNF